MLGPIVPADPCDVSAYRFVRPHIEVTIEERSGRESVLIWLDTDARSSDVAAGDELLGGVRQLDGEDFLQRFVIVNPQRPHRAVQTALPNVNAGQSLALQTSCASKPLTDAAYRNVIHAEPDVSCGTVRVAPYRERGEVDDETIR